jgi:drug/metabolite transporter (DMT)-like permease
VTRHRAAQILVSLFGIGFILVVIAVGVEATRNKEGLSETANELLLAITSLIIGAVSGYLSRRVGDDPDDEVKSYVGLALASILGIVVLIFGVGFLWSAIFLDGDILQANALNLLTVVLGGSVGALSAYLGLNPQYSTSSEPRNAEEEE